MGKSVKSQWDFGELFPPEQLRKVLSVTELTGQVKRLLEQQVGQVWVSGEITNLKFQSSGHAYFTLKDAGSQVACVLFRGEREVDRTLLQDGRKVTVQGEVTVYEPRGQYQLIVTKVELQGVGALQAAFEKLKQRLNAEGLFAQERKRPLPRFPHRVGVVASPTGAAIRDVLHVVERRNPALSLILAPCRVQGDGAAREIAAAIRSLNDYHQSQTGVGAGLDLILVTRGGGSLEDLWAFNEEVLARAIFESALPVVSAVGHEIDFTISDFVADLRAATPSAAAEIITEGVFASCRFLTEVAGRLGELTRQHLEEKQDQLDQLAARAGRLHPRRRVQERLQRLDELEGSLQRCVKQATRQHRLAWRGAVERLLRVRPALLLQRKHEVCLQSAHRLHQRVHEQLEALRQRAVSLQDRLRLLGPEQVLARGYSITLDAESGKIVREAQATRKGQRLKTRLSAGEVMSRVEG